MPGWSRYLTPAAAHWGLGLVCLGAGGQSGHIGTVRERVLSSHAVVLVTAGRGRCNGRAVGPPALFHLLAGVPHTYGPDRHGWSEQWALYDGPAAGAYAELGYLPAEVTPLADAASAALLFTGCAVPSTAPTPRRRPPPPSTNSSPRWAALGSRTPSWSHWPATAPSRWPSRHANCP